MSTPLPPTPTRAPLAWPPLVGSERVPRAVRLRDGLLTLLAWCAFAWMLRGAMALAYDWLREPMGQFTYLQAPDWARLWQRLRSYVQVAGLLMAWLGFWAVYRSKTLRPAEHTPTPPAPLEEATLCQHFGTTPEQLQAWRAQRVITVEVAEDGAVLPGS